MWQRLGCSPSCLAHLASRTPHPHGHGEPSLQPANQNSGSTTGPAGSQPGPPGVTMHGLSDILAIALIPFGAPDSSQRAGSGWA